MKPVFLKYPVVEEGVYILGKFLSNNLFGRTFDSDITTGEIRVVAIFRSDGWAPQGTEESTEAIVFNFRNENARTGLG